MAHLWAPQGVVAARLLFAAVCQLLHAGWLPLRFACAQPGAVGWQEQWGQGKGGTDGALHSQGTRAVSLGLLMQGLKDRYLNSCFPETHFLESQAHRRKVAGSWHCRLPFHSVWGRQTAWPQLLTAGLSWDPLTTQACLAANE